MNLICNDESLEYELIFPLEIYKLEKLIKLFYISEKISDGIKVKPKKKSKEYSNFKKKKISDGGYTIYFYKPSAKNCLCILLRVLYYNIRLLLPLWVQFLP